MAAARSAHRQVVDPCGGLCHSGALELNDKEAHAFFTAPGDGLAGRPTLTEVGDLPAVPTTGHDDSGRPLAAAAAGGVAYFRFYGELNDFLAAPRRQRDSALGCASSATVKHLIETLGVPHTEVELILVNGRPVDFACRPRPGDRVSVYPAFATLPLGPLRRLRPPLAGRARFVVDAHLGGLARLLRLAGFDTVYDETLDDAAIARLAVDDGRIVLSRDRDLLERREISHGAYVHALDPDRQLVEILVRLDLAGHLRPFSRCLKCNAPLLAVDKALVVDALPPRVRHTQHEFSRCAVCRRVFWPGSHWRRMRERLAAAVAAAGGQRPSAVDDGPPRPGQDARRPRPSGTAP